VKTIRYEPRPIRFLELWKVHEWRFKVYGISYERDCPRPELVEAAKETASRLLREKPTQLLHYGVGFLGIHDGRGENQVFLDFWVNENELVHRYWISKPETPKDLRDAPEDHNSVCVWDLMVQCFERQAWVDCVLANPRGPDLNLYLDRRLDAVL
jgi:hypothetical protein